MSREEDKRLYEQKQCIYKGQEVSFSRLADDCFIASELIQCKDSDSLDETEKALLDTARVVDSLTDEKLEAEGYNSPFSYYDTVSETIETVKKTRLTSDKGGALRWFVPCVDVVDVSELQDKMLPPMKWLIDDFLPVGGVVMLSAKPKMGKSFLAIQLALSVASGGEFLGFQARKHEVLYIDLETSQRSMKNRISMMTDDAPKGLYLMTPQEVFEFGNVGNGFESQVNYFLESHKGVKLVIVDTYGIIKGHRKQNQGVYDFDYGEISHLNSWARKKGFTLVLIHHQNKQSDYDNPVMGISGSTGITAGLQAYYILTKRDYTDTRTKLTIGGKEIAERDIFIQPESDTNRTWVEDEPEDRPSRKTTVSNNPITMTIRDLCANSEEIEITAKELAERVGKSPRGVGLWLNQYEGELAEYQRIAFMKKHTENGTIYTFRME